MHYSSFNTGGFKLKNKCGHIFIIATRQYLPPTLLQINDENFYLINDSATDSLLDNSKRHVLSLKLLWGLACWLSFNVYVYQS